MIRTYSEAVKFLDTLIPTKQGLLMGKEGFERMKYFVFLLGNPQLSYPTIHVGGTSGKGSTATIIASIIGTKYKVGLNTSPHLIRINERIQIAKNIKYQISNIKYTDKELKILFHEIEDDRFVDLVIKIKPVIEEMEKSRYGKPTHFEAITAMAFLYFRDEKVDVAVFEVGLGGVWDGTNVIKSNVTVLTNVGLDHTEVLGERVEEIAENKAGIIKPNISVVSGVRQLSVIDILQKKCAQKNAGLSLLHRDFQYEIKNVSDRGSVFDYVGEKTYKDLELFLLGKHQVENAAVAIRAIEKFSIFNFQFSINDIKEGLKRVFIPGRLEVINKKPLVILDGAHNSDKIHALVKAIGDIYPDKKIVLLIAIKEDKNAKDILKSLISISKKIICTQYDLFRDYGYIRSYEANKLQKIIESFGEEIEVISIHDTKRAWKKALSMVRKDELILVTGSLYLVGELRKFIIRRLAD